MTWYEIALLVFIGVVFVWFTFLGGRGGQYVGKVIFAPLELLVIPLRAIHHASKDDNKHPLIQFLARLAVKVGGAVLFVLCCAFAVLYIFRRSLPRLWH